MSYSRFSSSSWYTFWSSSSGNDKDSQVFEICGITSFTYKQIKSDIDMCIAILKKTMKDEILEAEAQSKLSSEQRKKNFFGSDAVYLGAWTATDEEIEELKGYMLEFIIDVENSPHIV